MARILTAYHGRIYIDPSDKRGFRLTTEVDPRPHFPIRETSTTIDYDFRAMAKMSRKAVPNSPSWWNR